MPRLNIDADLLSTKTLRKIQDACSEDYITTLGIQTKLRFNAEMDKIRHLIYLREKLEV